MSEEKEIEMNLFEVFFSSIDLWSECQFGNGYRSILDYLIVVIFILTANIGPINKHVLGKACIKSPWPI